MLESVGLTAAAEVARASCLGEFLDLRIDCVQVLLGLRHRGGNGSLLAGILLDVLRKITNRVAPHDLGHAQLRAHMRIDQRIGVLHHVPVVAGKPLRIGAITDRARVVARGHFALGGNHGLQARLHLLHRTQQLAGFVRACRHIAAAQIARADALGEPKRLT